MLISTISCLICTFVVVATATDYDDQDSISVSDSDVTVDYLRTDTPESSTEQPVTKAEPDTAVDLGALLDAREDATVTLVAGDTRLLAHRAVLAARSPVFQRLLQDAATGEVAVPDMEGPVLRQLLTYLYTLQVPQTPATSPQLLAAAHQYGLSALKAACEQQVAAQLSVETAAATAVLAVRNSYDHLRKAAIDYIRDHIFHVMATRGWEDAIKRQPEAWIKVGRLLSESPESTAENSWPASGDQNPAADVLTMALESIPQTFHEDISVLRSLSQEKKDRRLLKAAEEGAVGQLQALLAAGADVGARDDWKRWTALHWAADRGDAEAVRLLLAAGAAVDARTTPWQMLTPLHLAVKKGHVAVVHLLLDAGADDNARDIYESMPLHMAADSGSTGAVLALLQRGAYRQARNNDGWTPLDVAREKKHYHLLQLLQESCCLTASPLVK